MQTRLIERESTHAKFSVTVPSNEVDQAYSAMLRNLSRQVKVPGFRPGKAPRGVLEAKIGKEAIAEEVRDALVETYYPRAVRELELTPVHAHFHADRPSEGQDYSFEVELELYPEIELPNLDDIIIDNEVPRVSDEMFNETVESIRRENVTLIPVERPAERGDQVMVETEAGEGNLLPIDLETAPAELAEQLLGRSIGDEVTLILSTDNDEDDEDADEDEWVKALDSDGEDDAEEDKTEVQAGAADDADEDAPDEDQPTTIGVVIRDIRAKELPEIDDEFAKTLGFDTWAETEARIRDNLQAELDVEAFEAQREEFIEKILAETSFEVPQTLLNRRKRSLVQNLANDLEGRGLSFENYLSYLEENDNRASFETELDESALNAVKRDLVLERLLEVRGTTLSNEEFSAALRHLAQRQGTDVSRLRRDLGDEWLENYRFMLTRDKALREAVRERLGATGETDRAGRETGSDEQPLETGNEAL